jgi:hypothetical protein
LKKIRVLTHGEDLSAEDAQTALEELNLMLKGLQLEAPSLWRQTDGAVTLVAETASYVLTPRPFRVVEARYRSADGIDLPLCPFVRQEYIDMPLKSSAGVPTSYYVDYQRAAATMYLWPVPSVVTTETIRYTSQRVFEDLDSLNDDIDIPQEYLETVGYQLAARLTDTYGKDEPRVVQRAEYLLAIASQADREDYVQFIPERRW